jgi:exodeoxyribonuclease V alpha subunit
VVGAGNLNAELQTVLNAGEDAVSRGSRNFHVDDKVMRIRNNYDKKVFNGDMGGLLWVDAEEQEVTITFDDREVLYDYPDLDEVVFAYAVSVYKS